MIPIYEVSLILEVGFEPTSFKSLPVRLGVTVDYSIILT